jgi:site-specific DNA-methyltransferase (adenine-specific)
MKSALHFRRSEHFGSCFTRYVASPLELNQLYTGDCLKLFPLLESTTIDLIFADPPFNIGYDYDIYDDRRDAETDMDGTVA